MTYKFVSIALAGGLALALHLTPASADPAPNGPPARGYALHRGGYSYTHADVINTYRSPRTNYGGASVYRDPNLDRQSPGGPFDHGFFFDSGMGLHGGDSPYMH